MVLQQTQAHYQRPDLRPLTTAHLAHTMTLLGMNLDELQQKIEGELASNPALEIVEGTYCPTCRRKLPPHVLCPKCAFSQNGQTDQTIVFVSQPRDFPGASRASAAEEYTDDNFAADTETLATYVLGQVATELEVEERPIAVHLLSSMDENGLLAVPLEDIARYQHVTTVEVEEVLRLIQRAEPVGVCSPSPREAMLVQLEVLGEMAPDAGLAARAIEEGFEALSRHKYAELGRILGVSASKAQGVAEFITENLNPFPARAYWGSVRHPTKDSPNVYHQPDVIIRRGDDSQDPQLVVEIVWPIRGYLRISPLFDQAVKEAPADKAEAWKEDKERASLLIKCLGQRNHTLVRLMQLLANLQREFILRGDRFIHPITRASLADELGVHESTVSRAVAGKSVQFPSGHIVPISRFFDRSLHVRTVIKKIIADEKAPMSDTQIAQLLSKKGFKVARRTVAKYRAMEGILPTHLRNSKSNGVHESTA